MIYTIMVANVSEDREKEIYLTNNIAFVGTNLEKAYECYLDLLKNFEYIAIYGFGDNSKVSFDGRREWLWDLLQGVEFNNGDSYSRILNLSDFNELGYKADIICIHNQISVSKLNYEIDSIHS